MEPIFVPSRERVERSQMTAFARFVEERTGEPVPDAAALHAFSVASFRVFWRLFLEWSALDVAGSADPVCAGDGCEDARFFPALSLAYVPNLLAPASVKDDDRPAITACTEDGGREVVTRAELRRRVLTIASALRARGVREGDHVVAVVSNTMGAALAYLACLTLGATWSAVGPELGVEAILERFSPLAPRVLFASTRFVRDGETRDLAGRMGAVAAALASLSLVVPVDEGKIADSANLVAPCVGLGELLEHAASPEELDLARVTRFPFDHPLLVLFSSGTSGPPKCIVHGAGGTLFEHHKEHRLHLDLGPDDKLYFHTACGWMMYNWLVSALACGTEILLYDGGVSYPTADTLWSLVARERVTVFGTSPSYLQFCRRAGLHPAKTHDLSALRAVLSTGAVLPDPLYAWVRDHVKSLPLQSISGGTDIVGCFLLGHPNLPVYAGELQSKSLGLDVQAMPIADLAESAIAPDVEAIGDLVCKNPFPSRPIGLLGDPGGRRFHEAYFSKNPGVWTHGDILELTARGTARVHGRSDGVLNVRGVRIGPAEIYRALQSVPEIADVMAIEAGSPSDPGGTRLVLLVVLHDGGDGRPLDQELTGRIKRELAERCSPSHVPAVIAGLGSLPTTLSGKPSERAARDAVNGLRAGNRAALRNPESLDEIARHPLLSGRTGGR